MYAICSNSLDGQVALYTITVKVTNGFISGTLERIHYLVYIMKIKKNTAPYLTEEIRPVPASSYNVFTGRAIEKVSLMINRSGLHYIKGSILLSDY